MNEIPTSIVDYMEFYLLNYFKPATGQHTPKPSSAGAFVKTLPGRIGCASCHVPDLRIDRDRRVADVETVYDPERGNPFNRLFATARPSTRPPSTTAAATRRSRGRTEARSWCGTSSPTSNATTSGRTSTSGTTTGRAARSSSRPPLWGVGYTGPYGHDGRSMNLEDVILRHGGEAQESRDAFARLSGTSRRQVIAFLNTLVLFPPDDTASNLQPVERRTQKFPQKGHGSIRLSASSTIRPTRSEADQGDSRIARLPAATSWRSVTRPGGPAHRDAVGLRGVGEAEVELAGARGQERIARGDDLGSREACGLDGNRRPEGLAGRSTAARSPSGRLRARRREFSLARGCG